MTLRLDTTAAVAPSDIFSPAGDSYLQFTGSNARSKADVMVRCDPAAPWVLVSTLSQKRPLDRIAKAPFMQLVPSDLGIKVWDNE